MHRKIPTRSRERLADGTMSSVPGANITAVDAA